MCPAGNGLPPGSRPVPPSMRTATSTWRPATATSPRSASWAAHRSSTGRRAPSPRPRTNRVPPDAFSVNPDAGTVTIFNMRNITLDLAHMAQPDQIPAPGLGSRYGIPIAVDYIDINGTPQQDTSWIPLNLLYQFQT